MRVGDVKPELEGRTRMDVDDRDHDERDEAEKPEDLKRVLAARQPSELERQKHFQMNHAVFAPWCEACVKAKGSRSTAQ